MTKRRPVKKRRMQSRVGSSMTRTVSVPFRDVTTVARTSSAGYEITTINLNIPSFAATSRVRLLAGVYEFFRIRSLRVKVVSDTTAVNMVDGGTSALVGYAHGVGFSASASGSFTAPTSFDELLQFPNAVMGPSHKDLVIRMNKSMLSGSTPTKWYHTATTGTPPTADSSAGCVTYATRTLSSFSGSYSASYIELMGVVEFKVPIASGDAAGLISDTHVVGEGKELRIDTIGEHFDYANPRASVRRDSEMIRSLPNTPRSNSSVVATVTYSDEYEAGGLRRIERPRLARQ